MRWTPIIIVSVASTYLSGALGHPAPFTNSTLHALNKRTDVCGIDIRFATKNDCLDRHSVINFKRDTTATRELLTQETVPANAQTGPIDSSCDHVLELQVVGKAMQQSTLCGIVSALNSLQELEGAAVKRTNVLQPIADIANGIDNLFFLDSRVNGAVSGTFGISIKFASKLIMLCSKKASFVQLAVGNQVISSTHNAFFPAVQVYLRKDTIASSSRKVAADLDAAIKVILNQATTLAEGFPPPPPPPPPAGTPPRDVVLQKKLRDALNEMQAAHAAQRVEEKISVINLWNRALLAAVVHV
ncbi:hypothetical protein SISNIDRAFT_463443 [Sistotremastrum niveocremeum HHB9708]|uniref:Uncharacterized protein n=1 Tax=Sistotremastrum niveocremeum HHB9708 TaxID=1314777 RepID=A0A164Y804_9AGAM|nr:hypothetical protein SISNIDRAFT_463443 [Sistotremastrum niveocremeum HHB9708]